MNNEMPETREERIAKWGEGPWLDEPDRLEFRHAGLPCLLVRNHLGNWCGYAGVPREHPLYGLGEEAAEDAVDLPTHRPITYASACSGRVCHVPEPGESDDVWWFGFACTHLGDLRPGIAVIIKRVGELPSLIRGDVYRDMAYVRTVTSELAERLAALAKR